MRTATRLSVVAALALGLGVPASASAGEPIMPLSEVQPGMHCVGASVVSGTTISTFDADVQSVVAGDRGSAQPYLLIRVSGPAVDATGIGPGFSGSPIRCPRADGTMPIAGAIALGIGQYGNNVALATPIQSVLSEPVDAPTHLRVDPALVDHATPLADPLSFGGLSPRVGDLVVKAGRIAKRDVLAAPAAPRDALFAPQTLQPGATLGAGLASGDFSLGDIGTVTYVDGDRVWGFGHPMDGAGKRSLFLEDGFVYSVIGNPLTTEDQTTSKFAALGHDLGTLTFDGASGVAGRTGALPPHFPLTITAKDLDTGQRHVANVDVADESALGNPTGASALSQIAGAAVAQMAYVTLGGNPIHQSGDMCVSIAITELPTPLRFCNTYAGSKVDDDTGVGGAPLVSDVTAATQALDAYKFGPLHVKNVQIGLRLRRSLRIAYVLGVRAPQVARRGRRVPVAVHIRRQNGAPSTRVVGVRIPRSLHRGSHTLRISGVAPDLSTSPDDAMATVIDVSDASDDSDATGDAGDTSVAQLADDIAAIHRPDGLTATIGKGAGTQVSGQSGLRIAGSASTTIRVK